MSDHLASTVRTGQVAEDPPAVRAVFDRVLDVAVVLMERSDGVQIAIGFEKVTHVLSLPAASARVTAVRRRDFAVIFDFEPTCPARLEVRAAWTTLATLS